MFNCGVWGSAEVHSPNVLASQLDGAQALWKFCKLCTTTDSRPYPWLLCNIYVR